MISHFWNLCRACPALDVDKLHSEYRSTYKWHEFTPKQASSGGQQEVVRNPPLSSNTDFQFMRKKKHPDVAYKSHEFFDMSLAPGFPHRSSGGDTVDARYETREERRRFRGDGSTSAGRRAQSEGPGIRNPLFRDDGNEIRPAVGKGAIRSTEVAPIHNRRDRSAPNKDPVDPMHSSFPAPSTSGEEAKKNGKQKNGSRQAAQMKESLSMGNILPSGPLSAKSETTNAGLDSTATKAASTNVVVGSEDNGSEATTTTTRRRREYSSEYRKSFRPFSQYEYVDGRFVPSVGFHLKPSAIAAASANKAASLHGEPWYQEVVELRRQAQDYKCRGWGTESMSSPHSTSHYYKQIELYEQATRRESLSALSLAITTPRPTSSVSGKDDKAGERISPTKVASHYYRPSRPRTAPPPVRGSSAKSSRSESAHPVSETAAAAHPSGTRPPSVGPRGSRDHVDSSRSKQAPARARSPTKRVVSRPPSASTASSSVAPSPAPEPEMNGASGKAAPAKAQQQQSSSKRQRPIEREGSVKTASSSASAAAVPEAVATSSVASCHGSASTAPRRPFSRSSSKTGGAGVGVGGSRDTSRPPSAFENNIDYFREPVVKSPPEPTRVKSPEGIIRSPDPINWTVPLDTAKTFSVTQSVRDGDSARNSPMSDHSSLFDSVSGTAINLGRGGYHHPQRISSLAKEAILQPGLIKDSTMTRPGVSVAVDPSKPLATEAHPNPSIPESAEESKDDSIPDVMTTSVYQPNGNGASHHINGSGDEPKTVSGTRGLKCLEDPSFEFEAAPAPPKEISSPPKKPSYRVLEDPFEAEKSYGPPAKASKAASPYKVLEDPMCASVYEGGPSQSSGGIVSNRPMAAEVLEGARERFDKFWGGKNKEPSSGDS